MVHIRFFMRHKLAFVKNYSCLTSIHQLKCEFSNVIQIPVEHIQLFRWHVFLDDRKTLEYLKPTPGQEIDLVAVNTSSLIPPQLEDNIVPDIITVHVTDESGDSKDITVEIEDRSIQKPFLGGFSHKDSGIEYHHAQTQSGPRKSNGPAHLKNHRDTQTIDTRNRHIQQSYSQATQMSNEHTYIPAVTDKIMRAQHYETAEEREARLNIIGKVRIIQRYYRAWKIRKSLKKLHVEYQRRLKNKEDEDQERFSEYKLSKIKEINAKTFPRTRDDFRMLYSMVDRWKKAQIDRISKNCSGAAKIAEFYLVLDKEIEMLSAIEKLRQRIKEEMKDVKLMNFFKAISDPVKWTGYKHLNIAMDTLETQQGRQYKRIFYEACDHTKPIENRLKFLKYLKENYLKDHNCVVSNELFKLIDREEQLLQHGVDESALEILRKRIEQLLLKHMKTPECNEGVTRRMEKLRQKEYDEDASFCPRCNQIKPNKEFPPISCRIMAIRSCTSCTWYDRVQEPWYDVAPYRMILRQIRRDERKRNNYTSIAYILEEKDIHYLVERIWHSRSVISEFTDISELRLCRWNKDEEWAPWNTILLTSKEVEYHLTIPEVEDVYDEELRIAVMDKNLLGRVIFANSLMLNAEFNKQTRPNTTKTMTTVETTEGTCYYTTSDAETGRSPESSPASEKNWEFGI